MTTALFSLFTHTPLFFHRYCIALMSTYQQRPGQALSLSSHVFEELPKLDPVTALSPRVIQILGDNPSAYTLQGTNSYLIGTGQKYVTHHCIGFS